MPLIFLSHTSEKAAQERQAAVEEQQRIAQQLAVTIVFIFFGIAIHGLVNAEESKRKAQTVLAATDFREAQQYYQNNNNHYALAHLAHAAQLDPERITNRILLNNHLQWGCFLPIAFFRHQNMVMAAQFSPDGKKVVTASDDKTARLWDARTGGPVGDSMRHEKGVWSAHFSPDGTKVVTASDDKTARLWDAKTGRPLGEPMRHGKGVVSAQFSPDGRWW